MGREKDRLIKEEARGWYSLTSKLVCDTCVRDEYLSSHIVENGKSAACGYCGTNPEQADIRCIPFDDLMNVIGNAINWAYTSADNKGIPYESAEGGYAFPEHMFSTYDLVVDELGLDFHERVLEDVVRALPDRTWCRKDFWVLSLRGALRSSWDDFIEKVKYETRYLFTLPEPSPNMGVEAPTTGPMTEDGGEAHGESSGLDRHPSPEGPELVNGDPDFGIDYDRQEGIPAYKMLDAIGQLIRGLELVGTFEVGRRIFRVRVEDKGRNLVGPQDFGPPSREQAIQPNRMSPSGIVMFYGAMDRDTALVETFQPRRDEAGNKRVWVACFEVVKTLRLLDLTKLPPIPSIFDARSRDLRDGIAFLHEFADDLVQPIERDGREHIDYVPTQIVTEYVRHRFRTQHGESLHGILYGSSKRPAGFACVLFIDQTNCGVEVEAWWKKPEQILRLVENGIEVLEGALAGSWYPGVEGDTRLEMQ